MAQLFSNAARSELSGAIIAGDTSFSIVDSGSEFPVANTGASAIGPGADWFKAVLQDASGIEIVFVRTHTSASTSFSNVIRGQEGTTARSFAAGSTFGLRPTAGDATDTAAALALKAPIASPTFTGTVSGVTKAHVGLSNVDNTSDASKPVSTAQQTALNLKANLASPTFTGTVGGITAAMVGLSNVDNTSNATERAAAATLTNKTISGSANTLTNVAQSSVTNLTSDLAAKAPLASPTFTGTPAAPTAAVDTNTTQLATTGHTYAAKTQLSLNSQTGTSYTLVLADAGKRVDMSNASANVLTVPPNSSVAFPVNTIIFVSQGGVGATSIAAGSGVTINYASGLNIGGRYRMSSLIKTATDVWLSVGTIS